MKSFPKFHPVKWHIWVSGDIIREYHQYDNAAFLADDNISASSFLSSYPAITSKQAHKLTGQYKGQYIWGMDGSIWGRAEKKSFILRPRILSAYMRAVLRRRVFCEGSCRPALLHLPADPLIIQTSHPPLANHYHPEHHKDTKQTIILMEAIWRQKFCFFKSKFKFNLSIACPTILYNVLCQETPLPLKRVSPFTE